MAVHGSIGGNHPLPRVHEFGGGEGGKLDDKIMNLKIYDVEVDGDCGDGRRTYRVEASTEDDAMQLAFAMDGGWGGDRDATGLLALAKSYCRATEIQP